MTATDLRDLERLPVPDVPDWTLAEQSAHRQALAADGLIPKWSCLPCLRGEHGDDCQGRPCLCRCRAVLDGPFGGLGDPTAPGPDDLEGVA